MVNLNAEFCVQHRLDHTITRQTSKSLNKNKWSFYFLKRHFWFYFITETLCMHLTQREVKKKQIPFNLELLMSLHCQRGAWFFQKKVYSVQCDVFGAVIILIALNLYCNKWLHCTMYKLKSAHTYTHTSAIEMPNFFRPIPFSLK